MLRLRCCGCSSRRPTGELRAGQEKPASSRPPGSTSGAIRNATYGDAGLGDGPIHLRARPWCTEDVGADLFARHAGQGLDGDDVVRRDARPVAYSLRSDAPQTAAMAASPCRSISSASMVSLLRAIGLVKRCFSSASSRACPAASNDCAKLSDRRAARVGSDLCGKLKPGLTFRLRRD